MDVKITLVDINPKMVAAWRETFEDSPEVTVVQGSMLDQNVSAWVTPTNSKASMDGGLDGVIKRHLGDFIEGRVQKEIARLFGGTLPVGHATCVPTSCPNPVYLISTPTMHASSEDISDTLNVALACAAAIQAVRVQNSREPGSIRSVALPGLEDHIAGKPKPPLLRVHQFHIAGQSFAFAEGVASLSGAKGGNRWPGGFAFDGRRRRRGDNMLFGTQDRRTRKRSRTIGSASRSI